MSTELTLTTDSLNNSTYGLSTSLYTEPSSVLEPSSFLNSLGVLSLASSSSSSIREIITSLDEVQGTLTLRDGFLLTDLNTPLGDLRESYDLVSLATDFNESFQNTSGTLALVNGIASGNLVVDDEQFSGSFEFADFISSFVNDFLTTLNGTASFENGEITIDASTALGDIEGTIGFSNGAFVSDLTTPFGDLNFSFDFPEDAQYRAAIPGLGGVEGVLNLAAGQIEINLFAFNPGPEIAVPLSAFSGNISFNNGVVTLVTTIGSEQTSIQFNLAEEIGEELDELLTSATGTLEISDGQVIADIDTAVGNFNGAINVSQLIDDFIATIPDYNGTLTFADGTVEADLTTPSGAIDTTIEYASYLDEIADFVNRLTPTAIG